MLRVLKIKKKKLEIKFEIKNTAIFCGVFSYNKNVISMIRFFWLRFVFCLNKFVSKKRLVSFGSVLFFVKINS